MQGTADIELVSTRAMSATVTRTRINLAIAAVLVMFCAIVLRLVLLGLVVTDASIDGQSRAAIQAGLPLVTDRNGIPMALDVRTAGWNSAEVSGQIIQRAAPLLGVAPRPGLPSDAPQIIR